MLKWINWWITWKPLARDMEGFTGISLPITFGKQSIYDYKLKLVLLFGSALHISSEHLSFQKPDMCKMHHKVNLLIDMFGNFASSL